VKEASEEKQANSTLDIIVTQEDISQPLRKPYSRKGTQKAEALSDAVHDKTA